MTQTLTATTTQVFYPALRYVDAHAAIAWLERAFGFERHEVYEGPNNTVAHAQLGLNGALIMLGSLPSGDASSPGGTPAQGGSSSASIYVYAADPDALHARAVAAGARIIREPNDTDYGSREFSAIDCEGYGWSFGTYRP